MPRRERIMRRVLYQKLLTIFLTARTYSGDDMLYCDLARDRTDEHCKYAGIAHCTVTVQKKHRNGNQEPDISVIACPCNKNHDTVKPFCMPCRDTVKHSCVPLLYAPEHNRPPFHIIPDVHDICTKIITIVS